MSQPTFLGGGSTPNRTDTKWTILQRILGAIVGGFANKGNQYRGDGDPEGVVTGSATPPDTYWDETNKILYVKDSGTNTNTGWQAH